jgi:hypothetical protein
MVSPEDGIGCVGWGRPCNIPYGGQMTYLLDTNISSLASEALFLNNLAIPIHV